METGAVYFEEKRAAMWVYDGGVYVCLYVVCALVAWYCLACQHMYLGIPLPLTLF